MEKYHRKTFRVVAILFMLSTAPFAVSYSYAENVEGPELETQKIPNLVSKSQWEFGDSEFEKFKDGDIEKLSVFPENPKKDDMNGFLSSEGTSNRPYFDYLGHHSGIVIFDGKTSKAEAKNWKFSVDGTINLSKVEFDIKLSGKSHSSNLETIEAGSNDVLGYRVIFSGKIIDSDEKSEFAIALMSSQKTSDTTPNTKFLQIWHPVSEAVNSLEVKQMVGNSIF